ncbi:MAG: M56 family metallopeptidase [Lachnospiraceae bacterium]|nr:M56 family metallopeptidase [Lachnospiraceae bacterium]
MIERLFVGVLNMSLTASVIILAVCVIRFLWRGAPRIFSYILWAVVLFRLLCPFSFSSAFSLLNAVPESAADGGTMEYISYDLARTGQTGAQMQVPVVRLNSDLSVSVPAAAVGDSADPAQIVLFVAACVWLLGLCALLLWNLLSLLRFRGRLRGAEHLRENIYRLSDGGTPFVYGLLRPRIYLPLGLGAEEERYTLLHEQIHIRRGDPIFRFLACAALCLHWFNPLVWLAFALSGKDMEMSCDEAVLRKLGGGVKKEYSASLLALATGERALRSIPVAFGESSTKSRIKNVLSYQKAKPVIVAVAAVICVLALVFLAANPSGGEKSGGTNEEMYGETVANLGDDEQFALVDIGMANDVLLVTDGSYDYDGVNASIGCEVYYYIDREVRDLGRIESMSTAYPVCYGEKCLYTASNSSFEIYVIDTEERALVTETQYKADYSEDDGVYYKITDGAEIISEEEFWASFEIYAAGTVVNFGYGASDAAVETEQESETAGEDPDGDDAGQAATGGEEESPADADSTDLSAYGVEYQVFTEDTLYPYLLEVAQSEGVDLLETWYTQVDELTADIGEGNGVETIEIYTGDSGDGDSGIVLFKNAGGEELYAETAHTSRAGWNNIYLGSMDGTGFIMTLYMEDRDVYGAYSYQVFRLGEEGQVLQIAGSSFNFGSEYLYDDDIFREWAEEMSAYLEESVLLLSSQDGELRTEQVSEADKYNYETLRRE